MEEPPAKPIPKQSEIERITPNTPVTAKLGELLKNVMPENRHAETFADLLDSERW